MVMFLDTMEINVKSGRGGNGAVAFRREAFVPKGGPGGGDGGNGGSVYLRADTNKRTLIDFKYQPRFAAQNGKPGGTSTKTGKTGKDLYIPVPAGTVVYDADSGEVLADLVGGGDRLLAARGGKGGRGNAAFATATRQTPRFAEMGERGEKRDLRLELKLVADVGIVGYPNVGKSTLISRISSAKPKIAPYHFTTLAPNLGVVRLDYGRSFVVADVPGLIEGAHEGIGLGHQFLRHVERTRMLIHMVDVAGTEGRDPVNDYEMINRELALHDARLVELPQVIGLNKMDVLQEEENLGRMEQRAREDGRDAFRISAVTGEGVAELIGRVGAVVEEIRPLDDFAAADRKPQVFETPLPPHRRLEIRRMAPHIYVVRGTDVEKVIERTDLESPGGVDWLHTRLDETGVLERLDSAGAEPGDTVFIGEAELVYAGL